MCPEGNGDGRVRVAVNAIQIDYTSTDLDAAAIQVMTTSVDKRNSDFYTRQSGIFLLDDPENFQQNHQALTYLDGSLPLEGAMDWENMTRPWSDWPEGGAVETVNLQPTGCGSPGGYRPPKRTKRPLPASRLCGTICSERGA